MPSSDETSARRRAVAAHACPACEQPWAVRATRNLDGLFLLVCRFCEWREVRHPTTGRAAPAARAATAQQEAQHVVLFSDDDEHLVSRLTDVVTAALEGGASCLVIATEEHRSRLVERLADRSAPSAGLVLLDAEEVLALFLREGRPDASLFAASVGALVRDQVRDGRPVHAFGEMVALLWERGSLDAALELEVLWGRLADQVGLSLLCAYRAAAVDGALDGRARVCRHHTSVAA